VRTFYYNGFTFSLLRPLLGHPMAISLCWALLALATVAIVVVVPNVLRASFLLAATLLLVMPTAHQWYFLLVVVFLPLFPSPGWILLCGTIAATFATRITLEATGVWHDFAWARFVEYGPLVLAGVFRVLRGAGVGPWRFHEVESVAVVIPTLDERDHLERSLAALREQSRKAEEIFVVDGGSRDGTAEAARRFEAVKVLEARGGRGMQIAAGVAAARSDVVLVLHADSRLEGGALERMVRALNVHPDAAGGAFEGRFDSRSRTLAAVAWLNRFRARVLGLSFGDQGQFFRRTVLPGGFPTLALMEDVELALRVQEAGASLCLPGGPVTSPRRWQKRGAVRNAARVVSLVGEFLLRRRLGLLRDGGAAFYRRYYGRPLPE
jgi:rSAM/selenodomain-associated transferase 2